MFETTTSAARDSTISSVIIETVIVLLALSITYCVAASASTAIDVT
jgi:hypothetical protein